MIASVLFREFRPSSGSVPAIRFLLGVFTMVGALIFLGCPLRMTIRLGSDVLNALVGLVGFVSGIFIGSLFLRKEFDVGGSKRAVSLEGFVLAIIMLLLLVFIFAKPVPNTEAGGPIFFSKEGPSSMKAPFLISLIAALIVGFLAQRTSFCTVGGFRDFILLRETRLFLGWLMLLLGVILGSVYLGTFKLGFLDQPISHTMHLWNFLGLFVVGLNGVLLGGCPLRQLILSVQGKEDSAIFVLGMIVGAVISHNFMLAASPDKRVSPYGQVALIWVSSFLFLLDFQESYIRRDSYEQSSRC